MIRILLFTFFATVVCQTHDEPVCVRLGNVYESMCPGRTERTGSFTQGFPCKRGIRGPKGERGLKGSKGEPDYDSLYELITHQIHAILETNKLNTNETWSRMLEMDERIKSLEKIVETRLSPQVHEELTTTESTDVYEITTPASSTNAYCGVQYGGKCFWVDKRGLRKMNFAEAEDICETHGGTPANIYSLEHYNMITEYIRAFIDNLHTSSIYVWTGMRYDMRGGSVTLFDGRSASFVKWRSGYPAEGDSGEITLFVYMDTSHKNNHMYNYNSSKKQGVLCEN